MSKLLVYASKSGDTKAVAEYIAEKLGFKIMDAKEICQADIEEASALILAVSTHAQGQIFANFENKLELLNSIDLKGKPVGLVGVGNCERHGDDFCSGLSAFLPVLRNAKLVGLTDADGYNFSYSRAFVNGKFLGLTIDFKGDENWKNRADKWAMAVESEF
ncbi:flavodoxin domain-containing protein [Campylobacter sp. JMF_06 NA1]|uniref:flavodoxin domain-containing protein n=1 Tax=Campylobacter sp. JMF_06 NA1 TaxID=2983823 RepID=UPI0022E9B1D5|nr:flavodoxin domain-containing protein [Campylobacter sp. JMF_06 NA1]MDA3077647.1 flavodoxin domain-containing protein [Campylobacter sp. JMF_06 NA1]